MAKPGDRHQQQKQSEAHEEASDLNLRNLILAGAAVLAMIVAVNVLVTVLWGVLAPRFPTGEAPEPGEVAPAFPEPRLQSAPGQDLIELRATQEARLNSYSLEDGRARIPIRQAMEIIAEQGPELPPVGETEITGETAPPGEEGEAAGQGASLFQELGCSGCHMAQDTNLAPSLVGVAGETVALEDGSTITADEEYLRQSILEPMAHVVQGYQPVMPSFAGRVDDEQLAALVAYIQSLQEE